MKRQRTFQFVLCIILLTFAVIAQAQTKERFVVDTGIVILPSNHVLRVTGATATVNDTMTVSFRRLRYIEGTCNSSGVCVNEVVADDSSGPVSIAQGEAASYSASGTPASPSVRVILLTNNREVRVTAQIINQTTGEIVAIWVPQGSPVVAKQ